MNNMKMGCYYLPPSQRCGKNQGLNSQRFHIRWWRAALGEHYTIHKINHIEYPLLYM